MATDSFRRLGVLIQEGREAKGFTQTELGRQIEHSQSWVSEVENARNNSRTGRPITPGDADLLAISKVLEIPLADLHAALGRMPDNELIPEPILDELRGAAYAGEITEEGAAEIADYIRWKREQERRRKGLE